jgi:hypothetical protein
MLQRHRVQAYLLWWESAILNAKVGTITLSIK